MFRKDGTSLPVEYWSYPIHKDGGFVGCVVAFNDIAGRERIGGNLRQSEMMAALGKMSAGLTHESQQPGGGEARPLNDAPSDAVGHAVDALQQAQETDNLAYLFFATTTLGTALLEAGDSVAGRSRLETSRAVLVEQVDRGDRYPLTYL